MSFQPKDCLVYMPTRGYVYHSAINAMFGTILQTIRDLNQPLEFHFMQEKNQGAANCRNMIAQEFLASDKQVLIMVDDDIIIPENFLGIIDHLDEYAVVGAPTYIVRPGTIHLPNVFWHLGGDDWQIREEAYTFQGLVEVDAIGGGAIAIRRDVIQSLSKPFEPKTNRHGIVTVGEDIYFCSRARARGFKVAADFDRFCEHYTPLHGASLAHAYLSVITMMKERDAATSEIP